MNNKEDKERSNKKKEERRIRKKKGEAKTTQYGNVLVMKQVAMALFEAKTR